MVLNKNIKVHSTAIIDEGAEIGEGSMIWHWVHISSGAKIGKKCSFGQNVYIANSVKIGNGVKVQNNVSIYDNVVLEDDVFCGPSVVFTNVKNPRASIPRKSEYLDTHISRGVTLGANCTIVCGITIGEYAFVAAGAVVTRNVKPYALMAGVPARQVGWMSQFGNKLSLPIEGSARCLCVDSGEEYCLIDGSLFLEGDRR